MDKLPDSHHQAYWELRSRLERLRALVVESTVEAIAPKVLFTEGQNLQSYFQAEILTLSADDLDPAQAYHWQSFQTEICKTMRLLNTDMLFLTASRQAQTTEQRRQVICDRLSQLMDYCQYLTQGAIKP